MAVLSLDQLTEASWELQHASYRHQEYRHAVTVLDRLYRSCYDLPTGIRLEGYQVTWTYLFGDSVASPYLSDGSVSLETIRETLEKIWKSITQSLQDLVSKIRVMFSKIVDSLDTILKRVRWVIAITKPTVAHGEPQDHEVRYLYGYELSLSNQFKDKTLEEGYKRIDHAIHQTLPALIKASEIYNQYTSTTIKRIGGRDVDEALDDIIQQYDKMQQDMDKRYHYLSSEELPGGKYIHYDKATGQVKMQKRENLETSRMDVVYTLEIKQMYAFSQKLEKSIQELARSMSRYDELIKQTDRIRSESERLLHNLKTASGQIDDRPAVVAKYRKIIHSFNKDSLSTISQIHLYLIRYFKIVISYLTKHLAEYDIYPSMHSMHGIYAVN